MTHILLCTGEPILAEGLKQIVNQVPGFTLLPSCRSVPELLDGLGRTVPDLLLLDLLPEVTCTLLGDLKRAHPDMRTILLANSVTAEMALQAVGLGVRGILRRTLPIELQVKCLMKVQAGELWFERAFFLEGRPALTTREKQILDLVTQGFKNKEIAHAMSILEGSVKVRLVRLFRKVGAKDRFELALYGLRQRLAGNLPTAPQDHREDAQLQNPLSGVPASASIS